MDFQLRQIPLLSRVGADRDDRLRTDVDGAAAAWVHAALLRVDSHSQVLVTGGRGCSPTRSSWPTRHRRRRCFWALSTVGDISGQSAAR